MALRGSAMLVALAGCGRLDFGPLAADATVGRACGSDADCGPCQACTNDRCATTAISAVYLGHRSTCLLGDGGSRWCLGEFDGVGTAAGASPQFPTRIPGDDGWTALVLGYTTSLGVRAGDLYSFGMSPLADLGPDTYAEVAAEIDATCERTASGSVTCDGTAVPGTWSAIDTGWGRYCGIQSGALFCWGNDLNNVLGQGVEPDGTVIAAPAQVGTATDWMDVEIGDGLACARKLDNTMWCWGAGEATGTGFVDTMGVPTQISNRNDWTSFHVRWNHACGETSDGGIHCWGFDEYGLEVLPGSTAVGTPTDLGASYDQFLMGGHHYCGLTGGQWYCWGWNAAGQLAIGTTTTHQTPTVPICTQGT